MKTLELKTGKNIGKIVAVGAIAGISAYLLGKYLFSEKKDTLQNDSSNSMVQNISFVKTEKYLESLKVLKKRFSISKENINMRDIIAITQTIVELYKTKYIPLYIQNRKERREQINSKSEYAKIVLDGSSQGERILDEATSEVTLEIGITVDEYNYLVEQLAIQDPQFMQYMTYLFEAVKIQIIGENVKKLTIVKVMAFLQAQIDQIETADLQEFDILEEQLSTMCKQSYFVDIASIETGIEEEDIASNRDLLNNQEILQKHQELSQQMKKVIGQNLI